MALQRHSFLGRLKGASPFRKWEKVLQSPQEIPTPELTGLGAEMRAWRHKIDRMGAAVETEMLSRVTAVDGIDRPDQCDWAERSGPWHHAVRPRAHVNLASPTEIGSGVKLFHDANYADMSLRQDRVPSHVTGSTYGLVMEIYRFDGSFVSLVQDLPDAALKGLTLNHFIAVHLNIECEQEIEVYSRLNVQHGPNMEQIVRQVAIDGNRGVAEFDLAYAKINEKRLEKAWIDLIFESPEMNRVALWDMVMVRAPRADI